CCVGELEQAVHVDRAVRRDLRAKGVEVRGDEPVLGDLRELLRSGTSSGGGAAVEVVRRILEEVALLVDELDAVPVGIRVGEDTRGPEIRGGGVVRVEAHPGTFTLLSD